MEHRLRYWPRLPKVKRGRTLNVRVVGCKTLQRSATFICMFVSLRSTDKVIYFHENLPMTIIETSFMSSLSNHKDLNILFSVTFNLLHEHKSKSVITNT